MKLDSTTSYYFNLNLEDNNKVEHLFPSLERYTGTKIKIASTNLEKTTIVIEAKNSEIAKNTFAFIQEKVKNFNKPEFLDELKEKEYKQESQRPYRIFNYDRYIPRLSRNDNVEYFRTLYY